MDRFSANSAIIINVILGYILLYILGISGAYSVIIVGFLATYLTVSTERSYKVGGVAGGILGFMVFIFGFFMPSLPYTLNSLSSSQTISLQLNGIFNLMLAFILFMIICVLFGLIGGKIAQKILKKEPKKSNKTKYHTRNRMNSKNSKNKRPSRTLKRNYK
ncbi:MAG: hypothetical protein HZC47_07875 [Methanobacterium sp.]|uniref:hypothetical protein n=1 Tax=Methanobacterium sp. TaxID=2164 RepID=UPI003D6611CD|nr:hypothetical protein [Methanobacterium sp.]